MPQIDEMVRERITPARVRPVHEGPGAARVPADAPRARDRRPPDRGRPGLDHRGRRSTGLRSIAAGLHWRAGKEPAPERGRTAGWAERAARADSPEIAGGRADDGRPAGRPRPPASRQAARSGHCERVGRPSETEARCGPTGSAARASSASYREVAGITDPAQAIGPVPSGQPDLAERRSTRPCGRCSCPMRRPC